MSDPPSEPVSSAAEFEQRLRALFLVAQANDIQPAGSWVLRNEVGVPDWEVEVTELEKTP